MSLSFTLKFILFIRQMRKPGAYGFWMAYSRSKLANILFAVELRKRLAAVGSRIVVVTLHPGSIKTNIGAHGSKQALRSFTHAVFGIFQKVLRLLLRYSTRTVVHVRGMYTNNACSLVYIIVLQLSLS